MIADAVRPVQTQAGLTVLANYSFHHRPAMDAFLIPGGFGKVPIDRVAEIAPACRISRARVVDAGRIVTAGGIASGMELGFHLLRRAGYHEGFILRLPA